MTKLSDTQIILLSGASRREDGSLYPYSSSLTSPATAIAKSIASLLKQGLAEERETIAASAWRTDGDLRYGAFITPAGLSAIGIGEPGPAPEPASLPPALSAQRQTKAALVLELLQRDQGSTLDELIEATGWLPHTTRAALTGLRKKGHAIAKTKRRDVTCYRIEAQA
ncbi:DUF3489 domain-containing protein [Sphingomonas sp. AOB5]|uniref:DUF3489 domain-containing protein n=1 Tax=Sphingomonas sp. AOB5 TaxID=3034017 RepID=UPI0023F87AF4|nr:DUF3489 domain-containing protein [Sphingomonas sp. AOB5]MDF7773634.1 DUF3489 domain-containing protein [Sphingomonas sp. AOB5]